MYVKINKKEKFTRNMKENIQFCVQRKIKKSKETVAYRNRADTFDGEILKFLLLYCKICLKLNFSMFQ